MVVAPLTETVSHTVPQGWRRVVALMGRAGWRPWHYFLLLLLNAPIIASGTKAAAEDWQIVFYPWAEALRYSIVRYGQLPWWNPWAVGGQPFLTDPVQSVLMPDTLAIVMFGSVIGFKVLIVLYQLAGYEGSRRLCRHLYGDRPFVQAISVIPVILPALALHFYPGHMVFLPVYLFPWLLYYGLTWYQSRARALGLGIVVALHLLGNIHYALIMAFTIIAVVLLWTLARHARSREVWLRAALAVCVAFGLSFFRVVATFALALRFPRHEIFFYPLVGSLDVVIRTLVDPFQDPHTPGLYGLMWWELGSYVGLLGLLLAYEGVRRGARRLWPIHAGAIACLILAWNNRDPLFPSTYLHFIPPWSSMLVIIRWRLFACFFFLLGAVQGLLVIHESGRRKVAAGLALLLIGDLGFHFAYAVRDTFQTTAPRMVRGKDPPLSVYTASDRSHTWEHVRANEVALESECSLIGWGYRPTTRAHVGMPGYTGDFTLSPDLTLDQWTPNRILMHGKPGAEVAININPSNYWLLNGKQLFPDYRPIEPDLPFKFRVPESGRVDLRPRPPHMAALLAAQALFALLAVALYLRLGRRAQRRAATTIA
jgi:hypothetical protein